MNDDALGKMLLDRGMVTLGELSDAVAARRKSGKALGEVLVEKAILHRVQLEDVLAAAQKRLRFCAGCNSPVYVPRVTPEGERCPQCLDLLEWREETSTHRMQEVESIVQMTEDKLPPEVEQAKEEPGRVFGKYILLEELGHGGYGIVHKAWDTMMGEYVALKFMRDRDDGAESDEERKRRTQAQIMDLLQEARAALRLRHEHIVAIRDVGRVEQQFYICMEYVEGDTLADHIRASRMRGRLSPLYEDPTFYLGLVRDVANAIHYAHTFPKPIVHCDLKPANVLISVQGVGYVMDFGLARLIDESGQQQWSVRGTPAYMAPEMLAGEKGGTISVATDVYGLGGILYELLTGRALFTGQTPRVLEQVSLEIPERPAELVKKSGEPRRPDASAILARVGKLEEVAMRCLAKNPRERFAAARDVATELEAVIVSLTKPAAPVPGAKPSLPQRLQDAQQTTAFIKIDDMLASLRFDEAAKESEKLRTERNTTLVHRWVEHRRRHALILDRLLGRLVAKLNERRPTVAKLHLTTGTLERVELLKVTTKKLFAFHNDKSMDLDWPMIVPTQIVALAEAMSMSQPEDRLALGILCHHARLADMASRFLGTLSGTPLQKEAEAVLDPSVGK